jgi:hypothetical protein
MPREGPSTPGFSADAGFSFSISFRRGILFAERHIGGTFVSPQDHLKLTREELHNLVWAKPMTEVAKDFQISDRAMAKICARKQVPVPPRGHWAKKSAGQDVPKPSLPEFVPKAPKEEKAEPKPQQQPPKKPKVGGVFEERNQKIRKSLKELRNVLSEAVDYTARIESWNCDYSFGLNYSYNPLRRDNDVSFLYESPLSEYRDLVLKGAILEPRRLKERRFEARFTRRPHLNQKTIEEDLHHYEEAPPQFIGGFYNQGKCIMAYLPIPEDAFGLVLQNAMANKIKFMTLRGEKLRYGRGHIYGYSLQAEHNEEQP